MHPKRCVFLLGSAVCTVSQYNSDRLGIDNALHVLSDFWVVVFSFFSWMHHVLHLTMIQIGIGNALHVLPGFLFFMGHPVLHLTMIQIDIDNALHVLSNFCFIHGCTMFCISL